MMEAMVYTMSYGPGSFILIILGRLLTDQEAWGQVC